MPNNLDRLLSIASSPLRPSIPEMPQSLTARNDRTSELYAMLSKINGFFAFESALHVFPLGFGEGLALESWNSWSLWRSEYEDLPAGLFFFAEDGFGHQFAIHRSSLVLFDPETGTTIDFAPPLEIWQECIPDDYELQQGIHSSTDGNRNMALFQRI